MNERTSVFALAVLGASCLIPELALAARWKEVGWDTPAATGLVYADLDSIHLEGNYRIARFLTIYAAPAMSASGSKVDRILQQTAFDCEKQRFAFLSTVGYLEGKKINHSSPHDDWEQHLRAVPLDSYSRAAYDVACKSPLVAHPDLTTADGESPGTVKLPALDASGKTKPAAAHAATPGQQPTRPQPQGD